MRHRREPLLLAIRHVAPACYASEQTKEEDQEPVGCRARRLRPPWSASLKTGSFTRRLKSTAFRPKLSSGASTTTVDTRSSRDQEPRAHAATRLAGAARVRPSAPLGSAAARRIRASAARRPARWRGGQVLGAAAARRPSSRCAAVAGPCLQTRRRRRQL